jgi:hypothetical protein
LIKIKKWWNIKYSRGACKQGFLWCPLNIRTYKWVGFWGGGRVNLIYWGLYNMGIHGAQDMRIREDK